MTWRTFGGVTEANVAKTKGDKTKGELKVTILKVTILKMTIQKVPKLQFGQLWWPDLKLTKRITALRASPTTKCGECCPFYVNIVTAL